MFFLIDYFSIWYQLITESHLLNKYAQVLQLHFPLIFVCMYYELFDLFEKCICSYDM